MHEEIQLHIPSPCHENWNAMTPKEQGRFCGSCCKTVVDFSLMTDKEIVDYISKATHHVCGRFSNDQLNKPLPVTNNKKRYSFTYLWNVLLATLLITRANAQVKPVKKEKTSVVNIDSSLHTMGTIAIPEDAYIQKIEINGIVKDTITNKPIPQVTVMIKGSSRGTLTGDAGDFHLSVEKKDSVALVFSAIGFETQTLVVNENKDPQHMKVYLKQRNNDLMGEVVIVGQSFRKKKRK